MSLHCCVVAQEEAAVAVQAAVRGKLAKKKIQERQSQEAASSSANAADKES